MYRQNIVEYISFLKNDKIQNAKTINHKISSLAKFNSFLIDQKVQEEKVIYKTDMLKIQRAYASPTKVAEVEVKQFLQNILESKNKRNYAIVVLLSYTGLRISEALSIKLNDMNLQTGECIIRNGKGEKQRVVLLNRRIIYAIREYMKEREASVVSQASPYLFISKKESDLIVPSLTASLTSIVRRLPPINFVTSFVRTPLKKGLVFMKLRIKLDIPM